MAEKFAFTYEERKRMASQTAEILTEEIGLKGDAIEAVQLIPEIEEGNIALDEVEQKYGASVARILHGLNRIQQLYDKNPAVESENFRNLLLSFAEDMRVILIMIANRVNLMRQIRDTENVEAKLEVSQEAAYLYAPLAHKLGLYKLKSELEDLSLKYMEHDAYYHIREKLSATKAARDAYIDRFIKPVEQKMMEAGIRCHIKGRTKSIHSIWQKMQKQKRRKCSAGRLTRLLPICISLTLNDCATGLRNPNRMATRVCTSRCWAQSRSGLRYRYVPNVCTRLPNAV